MALQLGWGSHRAKIARVWCWLSALQITGCLFAGRPERPGWDGPKLAAAERCEAGEMPACSALGQLLVANFRSGKDIERGMVLLEAACGQNDWAACAALGEAYRDRGDAASSARAKELLTRACDGRAAAGCTTLGELLQLEDRHHEEHDENPARGAFDRACTLGDSRGCELYGLAEQRSDGDAAKARAEQAFALACGMGRRSTCHLLGIQRLQSPDGRKAGARLLIDNCAHGFDKSCLTVATLFAPVISANSDCAQAIPAAEHACDAKDPDGCAIGDACRLRTKRDGAEALQRLRHACDGGISLACFYWADAQTLPEALKPAPDAPAPHETVTPAPDAPASNDGGKPPSPPLVNDVKRAYGRACRGHSPGQGLACVRLVTLKLAEAKTVEEAEPLLTFLQKACEHSLGEACCELAEVNATSRWTPADPDKTSTLRAKACNLGQERCCH